MSEAAPVNHHPGNWRDNTSIAVGYQSLNTEYLMGFSDDIVSNADYFRHCSWNDDMMMVRF